MGKKNNKKELFADMSDTRCRICGGELWIMALCVKCDGAILFGCKDCAAVSETRVHIECLNKLSKTRLQ